jgi:hypothetical protein
MRKLLKLRKIARIKESVKERITERDGEYEKDREKNCRI